MKSDKISEAVVRDCPFTCGISRGLQRREVANGFFSGIGSKA